MGIRTIVAGACTLVFAAGSLVAVAQQKPVSSRTAITVYKTPT